MSLVTVETSFLTNESLSKPFTVREITLGTKTKIKCVFKNLFTERNVKRMSTVKHFQSNAIQHNIGFPQETLIMSHPDLFREWTTIATLFLLSFIS